MGTLHQALRLTGVLATVGVTFPLSPVARAETAQQQADVEKKFEALVASLLTQITDLKEVGRFVEALPLATRLLDLFEKAYGMESEYTARAVNMLGEVYRGLGQFENAEALFKRAVTITERVRGPEHPDAAVMLDDLGMLYFLKGEYSTAQDLVKRAVGVLEKSAGADDARTGHTLADLGLIYKETGQYAEAEYALTRALGISQKTHGPNHPTTAVILNNLGSVENARGDYAAADDTFKRALGVLEKTLGADSLDTASVLNNLAFNHMLTGAYRDAEPVYLRALKIYGRELGADHPDTATCIENLAKLYLAAGDYPNAEALFKRSLSIRDKVLGADHPFVAESLNNLATVYMSVSDYAQAEPLLKRAVGINEKVSGAGHPATAVALANLGHAYHGLGDDALAEPLMLRAVAIREKAVGADDPELATLLGNLALISWRDGRWSEALAREGRALRIEERNAQHLLAIGSEPRKRAYIGTLADSTRVMVGLSLAAAGKAAGAETLGLEAVLQRKSRVLDVMADSLATVRKNLTAEDRATFDQWRDANNQWATLTFRGPGGEGVDNYRARLAELRSTSDALEAQLSGARSGFRRRVETVTVLQVQEALPAGAVLIEWFRYRPVAPAPPTKPTGTATAPRYVAYLLKRGGDPIVVDVGDAKSIEVLLSDLLVALRDPGSALVVRLARNLDARLMQPLRAHLDGADRLLISPDGQLNLLPFGALRDQQGRYLIETTEITYLTSGRDVLRTINDAPIRQPPAVIANPAFGVAGERAADPPMRFTPLPATAQEAVALQAALQLSDARVLTGDRATEASLKDLHGPRILHLATHGFFLPGASPDLSSESRLPSAGLSAAPPGQNPLLRSGLALAGANALASGDDDGVVTGLEVTGLDLEGTELVVLSACETGVGQIQNGDGVYGLRRAFVLAGAHTQVASLWKVDDAATRDLMVDYYTRVRDGGGRAAALTRVQRSMLADPKRAHPFFWAAFVVIGDGRPIAW